MAFTKVYSNEQILMNPQPPPDGLSASVSAAERHRGHSAQITRSELCGLFIEA